MHFRLFFFEAFLLDQYDEWNEHPTDEDSGDEDFIDGVDTYHTPKEDLRYYDDYEDYGC